MTKEEYLSSQESIQKEIDELYALQFDKRKELNKLHYDWCNELCKQYADYIGERVKIVFKRNDGEGVVTGFLIGFSCRKIYGTAVIMPDIAKGKKGGTASKVLIPFEWDEIESIEKI